MRLSIGSAYYTGRVGKTLAAKGLIEINQHDAAAITPAGRQAIQTEKTDG